MGEHHLSLKSDQSSIFKQQEIGEHQIAQKQNTSAGVGDFRESVQKIDNSNQPWNCPPPEEPSIQQISKVILETRESDVVPINVKHENVEYQGTLTVTNASIDEATDIPKKSEPEAIKLIQNDDTLKKAMDELNELLKKPDGNSDRILEKAIFIAIMLAKRDGIIERKHFQEREWQIHLYADNIKGSYKDPWVNGVMICAGGLMIVAGVGTIVAAAAGIEALSTAAQGLSGIGKGIETGSEILKRNNESSRTSDQFFQEELKRRRQQSDKSDNDDSNELKDEFSLLKSNEQNRHQAIERSGG